MDIKYINLDVITAQYRKKGAALKGYRIINNLIKTNNVKSLSILLRHHKESPIRSRTEVQERDNIDFLIDYFSILEVGLIAGYLPNPLSVKTENEIKYILSNKYINKYFSENYPLVLPKLLLKQISKYRGEEYFDKSYHIESPISFDRFLILNQAVKKDADINQFLWFLDDGKTGGYSITDFWNVLKDKDIIKYKLDNSSQHPLNSSLWGFVKYVQFLSDFARLLRDAKYDYLLQSAFWHYQAYWFEHMKDRIGNIITIGLNNIKETMQNINSNEVIANKKSFLNSEGDISAWRNNIYQLNGVEDDINYLLNGSLGKPLEHYFINI